MEFLKVILIILLVYFGLKFLFRLLGPLLMKYAMKKMGKKFEEQFSQFNSMNKQQAPQEKEGEVVLDKVPKNKRKSSKTVGEYVEYEEVKD
ncbi:MULTISPECIES: DUF4834 family protein [Croceibacter]|jgi:hypothetical protein|uniref:DUF4834 family protein n=1 Tax=Croceibacter TaxID=216431 RepID=UPI000C5C43BB|nr:MULTISPECIES: DUF4834 family protein [Croceibacter]MBG26449.1 DUF4834 domain-containing protein [Croceibacter sp.]WSP33667.1 DUF4834 family protein [Croceibacter atlanticus]|tara:strand:+ start:3998 stop:4270 length:273 start_codon:yes stop_codon:yes gene_type:complete